MTSQILPEILPEIQFPELPAEEAGLLDRMQRPCGCCAVKETEEELALAAMWDNEQHIRLLDGAIRTIRKIPNNSEWSALFPAVERLTKLISDLPNGELSGPFYVGMRRGLHDADYHNQYIGTFLDRRIYNMHFYDSVTRASFFPDRPQNARTEGQRYFDYSIQFDPDPAHNDTRRAVGYLLGLSLHYLTDLTQPMHAVNFTNVLDYRTWGSSPNWDDMRHSAFEKYADSDRFKCQPGQYTVAQLDPARWGGAEGAGSILHKVSACSRELYDTTGLRQLVDSTPPAGSFGATADPHIIRCLDHGFYHTAMFLLYWAQRARSNRRP